MDKLVESPVDNLGTSDQPLRAFETFQVGETHRSPIHVIEQDAIDRFAELTGDHNPVHLDPEFARRTVFRGTVAHGLYLASVLAGMAYAHGLMGRNILALEKSEETYLAGVRPGDEVYGIVEITGTDADATRRCGRVRWELKMIRFKRDGSEEVAVLARWDTLVFKERFLRA